MENDKNLIEGIALECSKLLYATMKETGLQKHITMTAEIEGVKFMLKFERIDESSIGKSPIPDVIKSVCDHPKDRRDLNNNNYCHKCRTYINT